MFLMFPITSFFLALIGGSIGKYITNFIDILEFYHGQRYGVESTLSSIAASSAYTFVHWQTRNSFTDYTFPIICGVIIGLLPILFHGTYDLKLYGLMLLGIVFSGILIYFLPGLFNIIDNGFLIIEIPLRTLFILIGMTVVYWSLHYLKILLN